MTEEESSPVKMIQLEQDQLEDLYSWLDEIPLTRPKRNVGRDFSDGVLMAEVVAHFLPRLVELHNYTPASSTKQKKDNWKTLNRKVLCKFHFSVPDHVVNSVVNVKPGVIENVLWQVRQKIDIFLMKRKSNPQKVSLFEMSPDGYLDGQEVGSQPPKGNRIGMGRPPKAPAAGPKAPIVLHPPQGYSDPRGASYRQQFNGGIEPELPPAVRMVIEQKEQALLASQETVQILQAKVRRLEHLLKLKDDRIEELMKRRDGMQKTQGYY
ncbi:sperm flagellar protein 1-like [Diadema antillarum]|uniref:sperm flagellar protein 1-like n=1 Tax=Diadema antillarum TaxID=105358 RepID=UPI003A853503